jgi:hypothetical protein
MAKTLIKTTGAISATTTEVTFVDGTSDVVLDDTYDVYEFHFYNIHPSDDAAKLMWLSRTGGAYGIATTSTFIQTYHSEADGNETLDENTDYDAAQEDGNLYLSDGVGKDDDQSASGIFTLYAPSSTTYIKHFMTKVQHVSAGDTCNISRTAGYINTTTAVDGIKFFFDANHIDAGEIKLFGVS